MSHAWIMKYAPKSREEVVGRENEMRILEEYLARKTKKPILLSGPPGSGKTSVVYAVANKHEIIEVNASDTRNKKSILAVVGEALKQRSLFMRDRLVLIDEVDGVSGMKDRGGNITIAKLIKETSTPMILTANDGMSDKLKALRKVCQVVQLEPLTNEHIIRKLQHIAAKEKVSLKEEIFSSLARRSGGDLRAAINDLQTVSSSKEQTLDVLGDRNHTAAIEDALLRVFKTTNADVARHAFDSIPLQPNDILMWLDENMPREYKKSADRARAFEALSKADVFLGRIRRWQYYRFYAHVYPLLSVGTALAKDEKYPGVGKYVRSERPLKIWIANMAQNKKKVIAEKIAAETHTSTRKVLQEFSYWLRMARNKSQLANIEERFDLDGEQVAWMRQKAT